MSHLLTQTKALSDQFQSGIVTHGVGLSTSAAQSTAAYPRKGFGTPNPRDELMKEKAELIKKYGPTTGMTPFGQVNLTDQDLQVLQQKRESEAYANFDSWAGSNFHKGDVATRKWFQEVLPEYYDSREREMVDRAKLALRIQLIKMRGPKNHKDLVIIWGLETGQIQLDRNWNIVGANIEGGQNINVTDEQARFAKGLFSVNRYKTDGERDKNANSYGNPFAPKSGGFNSGQIPSPFPGSSITTPRYPNFLDSVISNISN